MRVIAIITARGGSKRIPRKNIKDFCGKPIIKDQEKCIIYKTYTKINQLEDMAYVHKFCKDDELLYIDTDIVHLNNSKLSIILKDIEKTSPMPKNKSWKFRALEDFFNKSNTTPITLKFSDMENILGFKLCNSAYKHPAYWYQIRKGTISNCWSNQNYEIQKLDIEKNKVTFRKVINKLSKLNIPQIFLTNKIPNGAKYELEEFFKYITKKYGLSNKK